MNNSSKQQPRLDLVEESDRGCVLVGAAILEQRLEELFRVVFSGNGIGKKMQDTLFDTNGPLATFSSKVKLSYTLGFIAKEVYEDLDRIRRIRNDFAHSVNDVDFLSDDAVSAAIDGLHCVQHFKDEMPRYAPEKPPVELGRSYEASMRMAGFIKKTKAHFALGVRVLEAELLRSILRQEKKSVD
jgi:DNA-binding MltR family transcriptional regulator